MLFWFAYFSQHFLVYINIFISIWVSDFLWVATAFYYFNSLYIAFARTMHYQFYCWYFHTLPYLLWTVTMPNILRVAVLVAIEVAFNVYPATWWSSLILQVSWVFIRFNVSHFIRGHAIVLWAFWINCRLLMQAC